MDINKRNERLLNPNYKRRVRNLSQYKDMTDEEFDELWDKQLVDAAPVKEFEDRIQRKIKEFENDYDVSDMKINDLNVLRALCQALITLEDMEQASYKMRAEGFTGDNITKMEKVNRGMSDLRADISKLQDDLRITRKIRKGEREESVLAYIEKLKDKARRFARSRQMYIFCPKCKMLLGTLWTLYPDEERNKIRLVCNRVQDDGTKCNEVVHIGTSELLQRKGVNIDDIPEFYKI